MVRPSVLFYHCLSVGLSGFGVVVTRCLFGPLSLMCSPPPFCFSIPRWVPHCTAGVAGQPWRPQWVEKPQGMCPAPLASP